MFHRFDFFNFLLIFLLYRSDCLVSCLFLHYELIFVFLLHIFRNRRFFFLALHLLLLCLFDGLAFFFVLMQNKFFSKFLLLRPSIDIFIAFFNFFFLWLFFFSLNSYCLFVGFSFKCPLRLFFFVFFRLF